MPSATPTSKPPPAASALVSRLEVLRVARAYLGARWKHQGRSRWGVDCGGLVVMVAKELSLFDTTYRVYRRQGNGVELLRQCDEVLLRLDGLPAARPGDVLVFDDRGPYPIHLGILADKGHPYSLIHATPLARKVIEQRFDAYWQETCRVVYAFPGVEPWPS